MDQEIASLKLNTNQLTGITDVHRQTVATRLENVEPVVGSNSKFKLYPVTDILGEPMIPTVSASNAEGMKPSDRLAHRKAKNKRLKFKVDTKQFIPAEDIARKFSLTTKAVVTVLETLPGILERDCALTPAAVSHMQDVINDLRDQVAQKIMDAKQGEEEPEED